MTNREHVHENLFAIGYALENIRRLFLYAKSISKQDEKKIEELWKATDLAYEKLRLFLCAVCPTEKQKMIEKYEKARKRNMV